MVSLCLATLATNIAANVVSPANDFAHLWPRHLVQDGWADHWRRRHSDAALETLRRPDRLHLSLACRLLGTPGCHRRDLDHRLLSLRRTRLDLKALYQSGGDTGTGGFQPAGAHRPGRRHRALRPRLPWHNRRGGRCASLDLALSLRVVPELRNLGGLLRRADEAFREWPSASRP